MHIEIKYHDFFQRANTTSVLIIFKSKIDSRVVKIYKGIRAPNPLAYSLGLGRLSTHLHTYGHVGFQDMNEWSLGIFFRKSKGRFRGGMPGAYPTKKINYNKTFNHIMYVSMILSNTFFKLV